MEDIFLLPKAKAPVIFKVKTASALEFHILFFAFRRNCPADFTLCNFFLFAAQLLYNGTFGFLLDLLRSGFFDLRFHQRGLNFLNG